MGKALPHGLSEQDRPRDGRDGEPGSVLITDFIASSHAYLKLNGGKLLLVGQTDSPTLGVAYSPTQVSLAVKLPLGLQSAFLDEPASEVTNDVREITLWETPPGVSDVPAWLLMLRGLLEETKARDRNLLVLEGIVREASRRSLWTVSDLATFSGYSTRQLLRLFLRYTGFATKEFLELLRFERTYSERHLDPLADYYDQSHYIRDHRRFAGETPGKMRSRMSDLSNTTGRSAGIMGFQ